MIRPKTICKLWQFHQVVMPRILVNLAFQPSPNPIAGIIAMKAPGTFAASLGYRLYRIAYFRRRRLILLTVEGDLSLARKAPHSTSAFAFR